MTGCADPFDPARRRLIAGAAALALVPSAPARAEGAGTVTAALAAILRGRIARGEGIVLDVPDVAENGAQVPLAIRVESPMTEADHVTAIHILATANPVPQIGTFRLTPRLGRAEVFTRIRLAEGQEFHVLAELSDGRVLQAAAHTAVAVGGCTT